MTEPPQEKFENDQLRIDAEPLSGVVFDVGEVQVQDLGLTKVVAVPLAAPAETYTGEQQYIIKWALHSDTAEVSAVDGEEAYEVTLDDIVAVE